jgi:hypothetical protein
MMMSPGRAARGVQCLRIYLAGTQHFFYKTVLRCRLRRPPFDPLTNARPVPAKKKRNEAVAQGEHGCW